MTDINALLKQFQFKELLNSDPQTKSVVLLGEINGDTALVTIEKSHFVTDDFDINSTVQEAATINENDVYLWSNALVTQNLQDKPGAKLNLTYPATETHIKKYRHQASHYVVETPEMYTKYAADYIETMKGDRIKWVYNILFEGKEADTVVYHDKNPETGFVLLPDMKWDTINIDTLYLCAIVNRKDISTIRDLNATHLDWLKGVQSTIKTVAGEKYGVNQDQLRVFVHYHPSYYHFHIHVVNVKHPGLGNGIAVGKAILLDDIIENIAVASDFYQKRNIGYILGESHGLWNIEGYRNAHYNHHT